ncbi:phosphatidylserine/phosphatidylglycerophosphate/cardiolipin synthase family protein [Amycolatopsis sp. NPDC057786]|uniref:phospholipase D-like domain-containing protein n=1 Tax=Amycolatopsis sp. NPDC057786 TaxID=3346250 RepID=UPI0036718D9D
MKPHKRTTLLGALAAALLVAASSGVPATAAPSRLTTRADFNTPGGGQIVEYLEKLIRGAPENSTIKTAQFLLRDKPITEALADAAERGVHVQVLVDGGTTDHPNYQDLKKRLEKTGDKNSWAKNCKADRGCNGGNVMHNKFFLFDRTLDAPSVVATGSANLSENTTGGKGGWNSYYTDVGNVGLFARYNDYFADLRRVADGGTANPDYYEANPPVITGNTKSYFYPRLKDTGNDTVENTLKEVGCSTEKSKIRIGVWSLTRMKIIERLRILASRGCSVDIVALRMAKGSCEALMKGQPDRVRLRGFKKGNEAGIHEKNMMIEGDYLKPGTKVVFTGSQNFNNPSLHENDENVIRILDNDGIYRSFVRNFEQVAQATDQEIKSPGDCWKMVPED